MDTSFAGGSGSLETSVYVLGIVTISLLLSILTVLAFSSPSDQSYIVWLSELIVAYKVTLASYN